MIVIALFKRQVFKPLWPILLVGIFPIVWIAIAAAASGRHHWFQYRGLSVFVFSVLTFVISFIRTETTKHTDIVLSSADTESE